jgi:syntaxin 5
MPQQQQLLTANQDQYLDSRATAIEGIEKTIADLGSLFSQLTTMIAAHDDLVQRIDANVEDVEANVVGAQDQLMRYMQTVSSDRWLMLRIFMVLIVFFLLFVLFFA